jgi:hypothetical protein
MCWIALALVLTPAAALCAWRYYVGKWPLKFDL